MMDTFYNEVLEFTCRTRIHEDVDELVADFAHLIERFGFRSFILTGLPDEGFDVEPLVAVNGWPEAWSNRYREQQYFADDPVSIWSLTKSRPFHWQQAQRFIGATARTQQIEGEAYDHGLGGGIAFPQRGSRRNAVISLASEGFICVDDRIEASLYLASAYFKMSLEALVRTVPPPPKLTPREREVLSWAAAGKTAWETSEILCVAERTVKAHLESARQKLGVVNTTQAVASAIKTKELQL